MLDLYLGLKPCMCLAAQALALTVTGLDPGRGAVTCSCCVRGPSASKRRFARLCTQIMQVCRHVRINAQLIAPLPSKCT